MHRIAFWSSAPNSHNKIYWSTLWSPNRAYAYICDELKHISNTNKWVSEWVVHRSFHSRTFHASNGHAIWIDICLCFDKWIYMETHKVYSKFFNLVFLYAMHWSRELREFKYILKYIYELLYMYRTSMNAYHSEIINSTNSYIKFNLRTIASNICLSVCTRDREFAWI